MNPFEVASGDTDMIFIFYIYIITYRGSPQKTDDAECCCCTKARTVTHRGVLSQVDTAYTCFFSVCGKVRVFLFINSQGFNCCLL